MRVLYVIDSLGPGGAETSLVEMAPGLAGHGVDLHVLPLGMALDLAPALTTAGATVHERVAGAGRVGNVKAVLHAAKRIEPDLIHTTLYESDIAGRSAAWLRGIPSSTSLVSDSYNSSHAREYPRLKLRAARALDRATTQLASRFHAVSGAVADSVGTVLGIKRNIIEVIPRGRDPERFPFQSTSQREATRASLGIAADTPIVLAVGRLEQAKGMQHLLSAVPLIASQEPQAVVLIAGLDGRAATNLREQACGLPIEVRFLGHRTDVPALLAAADVFAFPSEREGSPGALIEAMAVGVPIVSSDIEPCMEVLGGNDPPVALVTQVGNSESFGAALIMALEDLKGAQRRAVEARKRFERYYTIDSVAERMADFFDHVS